MRQFERIEPKLTRLLAPKVIVIGLDGLDPACVAEFMPLFRSKTNVALDLLSTFPPDSSLAWPLAYTGIGLNELLKTTAFRLDDYKIEESSFERVLAKRIIGKTYWDELGLRNYKVCVLFPYPITTPYAINGILVTAKANGIFSVSSSKPMEHIRDSIFEFWTGLEHSTESGQARIDLAPRDNDNIGARALIELNLRVSEFRRRTKFLFKILTDSDRFDLVYFYTDLLEMQHIFWNCSDYVKYAYSLVENFLLNLFNTYGNDYIIIVHGDHGFRHREKYMLNIARISSDIFPKSSSGARQFARNFGVRFLVPQVLCGLHLEDIAIRSFYPKVKKLGVKLTSDYIQANKTALSNKSDVLYDPAFELRRFCGFHVGSEDGFKKIVATLRPYAERIYDIRRDTRLRASTVPESNVVFELKNNYASFYNENAPVRMLNPKGRSVPGTHSLKTAFYMLSSRFNVRALTCETAFMVDIAPTILNLYRLRRDSTIGSPIAEPEM